MVELALTLPFIIILLFSFVEFSRAWQAWHGAKLAADDGCYTAAIMKDVTQGQAVMATRAEQARLTDVDSAITAISNGTLTIGYECRINVRHFPLWSGFGVNVPGYGRVGLFDDGILISYQGDYFRSVF